MRFIKLLALFFTLFVSNGAYAAQWYFVGPDAQGNSFFIDFEQFAIRNGLAEVWIREDLKEPKFAGLLKPRIAQVIDQSVIDCSTNSIATQARYERDSSGGTVSSQIANHSQRQAVRSVPGSMGDVLVKYVCTVAPSILERIKKNGSASLIPPEILVTEWQQVGQTNDQLFFVNPSRIARGDGDYSEWLYFYQLWVNQTPTPFGVDTVKSTVGTWIVNCSNRTEALLETAYFGESNQLLFRSEQISINPIEVKPSTVGARIVDFVCLRGQNLLANQPQSVAKENSGVVAANEPSEPSVGSGTAWYVEGGYFVTAQHVIDGANKIYLAGSDGAPIAATVAVADSKNDVAILKADIGERKIRPIALSKGGAAIGSRVFTIGYPHFDLLGISPKVTSGEVSGTLPMEPTKVLISVPIQAGNSGGPLLNLSGEVVGLVIQKLSANKVLEETGDLTENTNFALKANYIAALLNDLPRRQTALQPEKAKPSSVEELTSLYKDSVYFVLTFSGASAKK